MLKDILAAASNLHTIVNNNPKESENINRALDNSIQD